MSSTASSTMLGARIDVTGAPVDKNDEIEALVIESEPTGKPMREKS